MEFGPFKFAKYRVKTEMRLLETPPFLTNQDCKHFWPCPGAVLTKPFHSGSSPGNQCIASFEGKASVSGAREDFEVNEPE